MVSTGMGYGASMNWSRKLTNKLYLQRQRGLDSEGSASISLLPSLTPSLALVTVPVWSPPCTRVGGRSYDQFWATASMACLHQRLLLSLLTLAALGFVLLRKVAFLPSARKEEVLSLGGL